MESRRQTRRQGCVDQGRPPVGRANKYGIRPRTQLLIPVFMRQAESRLGSHGGRRGPVRLEGTLDPSHAQSSFYTSPLPSYTCDGKGLTTCPQECASLVRDSCALESVWPVFSDTGIRKALGKPGDYTHHQIGVSTMPFPLGVG